MKKLLAMIMVLAMLLVSAASAEAAFTYTEYTYDESMFAEIGGEWVAIPELGLQFFVPDIFQATEVPDFLAEVGTVATFVSTDGTGALAISYGPTVDAEGNLMETIEDEAAFMISAGATNVDVIIINGIPVITALDAGNDNLMYSVYYGDGTQVIFTFSPASNTDIALMGGLMITSLMGIE